MTPAQDRDDTMGAWSWLWRIVVLAVVVGVGGLVARWFGIAGTRLGWLTTFAVFAGGGALLAWVLFRRDQRGVAVVVATVLVAAAVTVVLVRTTPPMPSALLAAFPEGTLPAEASVLETRSFGNAICFDYCPSVIRWYEAPGSAKQLTQSIGDQLRGRGWMINNGGPYPKGGFIAVSPDKAVEVTVVAGRASQPQGESGSNEPRARQPGYTVVEVSISEFVPSGA